jgi:hypothetical protein
MDYFNKEQPFRRKESRVLTNYPIRDMIYKVTKEVYSNHETEIRESYSPPRESIHKPNRPKPIKLMAKIIHTDHKINSKSIQIVKLPKLPFGKHSNYNNEDLFVSNHFIPSGDRKKTKELDEMVKKYRLFEKKYKKSRQNSLTAIGSLNNDKGIIKFKTNAGELICKENKNIIRYYEQNAANFKKKRILSDIDFPYLEETSSKKRRKVFKRSLDYVLTRLYPTPEPSTNQLLSRLDPKYTVLFSESII